jgi:hypothetical protein
VRLLSHAKAIEKVRTHAKVGGTENSWSAVTMSKERFGTGGLVGPVPMDMLYNQKLTLHILLVCVNGLMHRRMGSQVKPPQVDTT